MRWLKLCTIGSFPEVSFQIRNTVGIFLADKVMNNSWTIVWPNVLQFFWLVPGSLDKCHRTHMKLFSENIICSLYQVLKMIWNFSSNGSQAYFIKVSLVQLVVFLKGLACLYELFFQTWHPLKSIIFLKQQFKISSFQLSRHVKFIQNLQIFDMQFTCSLYAVYM